MDERAVPITEHLIELRSRVAWVLGAIALGSLLSFNFAEQIFGFLLAPATEALKAKNSHLQAIAPAEIFYTYMKCAILSGFILTLPVSFWHLWAFIAPGLYDNERRVIFPFVICSTGLFAGGAIFGYSVIFPVIFQFFNSWDNEWVVSAWTMREVFGMTTQLFLAFGIAFELPLFIFFLAVSGIVSAKQLFAGTPYAVVAMFIIGAILTPPDVLSQVLLSVPLIILYLAGACAAWFVDPERRKKKAEAGVVVVKPKN